MVSKVNSLIMPQLDHGHFFTQIFWLLVVFTLIYSFISLYFFPRISKIVERRKNRVKDDLSQAESLAAKNQNIKAKIQELLEESRQQAFEIKAKSRQQCEATITEQMAILEKELFKKIANDEEKLLRYKVQLEKEAEDLSDELFHDVINTINSQMHLANRSNN